MSHIAVLVSVTKRNSQQFRYIVERRSTNTGLLRLRR
jgi:hypothetical protein